MPENKDIEVFKIITLGDSGVGKTSIIKRFYENKFDDNTLSTIGINFSNKQITVDKKHKIILRLIDTCGQEKYRALAKSYFKNADIVLFVFSMNDKESFEKINTWMELFNENNNRENIPKYLVGTKNDLEKSVEQHLIDEFVRENNIPFMSTSSKENNNIYKLFEEIGENIYLNFMKKGAQKQATIKIKFKQSKKRCCDMT